MSSRYWIRAEYTAITSDEGIADLLRFCRDSRVHGVLLFTASFDTEPGLLTLDEIQKRATYLRRIVPRFRAEGLEVHIDVLTTLGHGAATLNTVESLGLEPMVDHLGNPMPGTPCPLGPAYLEWVAALYGHMARTGASVLWADDDVRYGIHGTPGFGCFCPLHLARVAEQLGGTITREELVAHLDTTDPIPTPERIAWQAANADAIVEMAEVLRRVVRAVDPSIRLGLMTVGYLTHAVEGRNTPRLLEALDPDGPRWFRPGPGFWSDERPREVVGKTEDAFRQTELAGGRCVRPLSEVENYPYTRANKSLQILHLELTLNALAGIADQGFTLFDTLGGVAATERDYRAFLAAEKPWLDAIADSIEGMSRRGIGVAADEQIGYFLPPAWRVATPEWPFALARLGLPLGPPTSSPQLISGEMADLVAPEEIEEIARAGLILDGPAAWRLARRGLAGMVGLKTVRAIEGCGYERLTEDPLNGAAGGRLLSWRHGAPEGGYYSAEAMGVDVRVLSRMLTIAGADLGAGILAIPRGDGGRVVVLPWGTPPHIRIVTAPRQEQFHAIVAWTAGGELPIAIRTAPNCYPIVWANGDDTRRLVAVANLTFDPASDLPVSLDPTEWAVEELSGDGRWIRRDAASHRRPPRIAIPPWDVAVLRLARS